MLRLLDFLEVYTGSLFGSGVHSSRVIRNSRRIAESQGADLTLYSSLRAMVLSLRRRETGEVVTRVVPVPDLPINFEWNTDLSALSWEALDERLSLEEIRERYDRIIARPGMNRWLILLLISLANGAFCHLFDGDWIAVGFVVLATAVGMMLKWQLTRWGLNIFMTTGVCAFVASMLASVSVVFPCTYQTAVATSVLFLVPGVPLINSVIDIVEHHIVTGISRIVKAFLLILCMGIGLAGTLLIMKSSLL